MRWLIGAMVALALLWAGLWTVASRVALAEARVLAGAAGLAHEGIAVAGFPSRLDLTVTAPRRAAPAAGAGAVWSAPFAQVLALAYRPWHAIVVMAHEQRLDLPGGGWTLRSDDLRGSVVLAPGRGLALERLAVVGQGLRLAPDLGPEAAVGTLRLAARADRSDPAALEIGLAALEIAPAPALLARLPAGSALPPAAEVLRLDAVARLSAPLDRFAAETRPELREIEVREIAFRWGPIALAGEGRIAPDLRGQAEGRIALRLDGWRQAIDAAVALGLLRAEIAPTWAEFARRLSEAAGTPERVELPLTLGRGRMRLGPIPLGPAPRLVP